MKKKYSTLPTAEKVQAITAFLEEHKGQDIVTLNLTHQNSFAEAMIVVTGTSMRHAQSLAEGVVVFCKKENFEWLRTEGKQTGQWILIDCNDIIVNVFQSSVRDLYKMEKLWEEIPKHIERTTTEEE